LKNSGKCTKRLKNSKCAERLKLQNLCLLRAWSACRDAKKPMCKGDWKLLDDRRECFVPTSLYCWGLLAWKGCLVS
jgi:hypothetical protein